MQVCHMRGEDPAETIAEAMRAGATSVRVTDTEAVPLWATFRPGCWYLGRRLIGESLTAGQLVRQMILGKRTRAVLVCVPWYTCPCGTVAALEEHCIDRLGGWVLPAVVCVGCKCSRHLRLLDYLQSLEGRP